MAPTDVVSEERLVEMAASGDRDAFRQLYLMHVPAVVGFVRRRAASADVPDIVADTFWCAWSGLSRFEWRGVTLRAWLIRIAARQMIDRSRLRSHSEIVTADCNPPPNPGFADELVDRLVSRERVRELLGSLTPEQRTVIVLRHIDGLDVTEVASLLGVTPEAVRARTYRALQTLRKVTVPG